MFTSIPVLSCPSALDKSRNSHSCVIYSLYTCANDESNQAHIVVEISQSDLPFAGFHQKKHARQTFAFMTPVVYANVSEQYQAHLTFEQVQAKALSELTSSSLLVHPLSTDLVPLTQGKDNTGLSESPARHFPAYQATRPQLAPPVRQRSVSARRLSNILTIFFQLHRQPQRKP